jgi:hypothetical protein
MGLCWQQKSSELTLVLKENALLPTPLVHAAMKHAVGCQAWWGISSLALSPVMTGGEIVNAVLFTMLVLNLTQEELGIVVAILELTAVRVDAAAHQMQAGVIFVAGLTAQLVPLGRHLAVGVIFETAGTTTKQMHGLQAICRIPFITGNRAVQSGAPARRSRK